MTATKPIRELRIITRSLRSIQSALARLAPALDAGREAGMAARGEGASTPRRNLKLSPARRAALKLQGQYMGYMRGLKPREKKQVKALAASKGIAQAVGLARRLAQA
jgi:hypothetical protein